MTRSINLSLVAVAMVTFSNFSSVSDAQVYLDGRRLEPFVLAETQAIPGSSALPGQYPPMPCSPDQKSIAEGNFHRSPFNLSVVAMIPIEQFALIVTADPRAPSRMRAQYTKAAEIITNQKILPPQLRIDYFKSLYHEQSPIVIGWKAQLISAQSTREGLVATVRVSADLGTFVDSAALLERYLITSEEVHLIDAIPSAAPRLIFGL